MVQNELDKWIAEAIKDKDEVGKNLYRSIKTEFMKYTTSKGAKPLDEAMEIQILNKMYKQRQDSISQYEEAGREDLASIEKQELRYLEGLLPQEPTPSEIVESLYDIAQEEGWLVEAGIDIVPQIPKNQMRIAIKLLKAEFPSADGKMVSEIVKNYIV